MSVGEDWQPSADHRFMPAALWSAPAQLAALAAIGLAMFFWRGRGMPVLPFLSPDSQSYLAYSPVRPHGYSVFLSAYRLLFPDLAHLPTVQLGSYLGAIFLLAVAVRERTGSFIAGLATLSIAAIGMDTSTFAYILSDPLYGAVLVAASAGFILYVARGRAGFLVLAGAGFGMAVTIRAVGWALLPGFLIAVPLAGLARRPGPLRAFIFAAAPIALLWLGAATSQLAHNGRFALGSWGGMDVLGKVPLLSGPAPAELGRLNDLVEAMGPARDKLRSLDPMLEALAARQYYEYLRWQVILPELARTWPAWRDADEYRRGQLAAALAKAYVAQDLIGFARRTATDWAGLWAMPRWLTPGEHDKAVLALDRAGELPGLSEFARTPDGGLQYYKIVPDPIRPASVWLFRLAVGLFWAFSLGLAAVLLWSRGRAAMLLPDLLLIAVAVHAVYAGTALMEGVFARYIMPTWPLVVAGPILGIALLQQRRHWLGRAA